METIRIGNDISVQWTILHDNVPERLEGRDLKVILSNSFEKIEIKDFLLVGNVIRFSYHGKDQVHCGVYTLTLYENYHKEGMMAVDVCEAFKLIPRSCEKKDRQSCSNLEISTVDINSSFDLLNNPKNTLVSDSVHRIEAVTQEEYDKIQVPNPNILYIIL